MPGSLAEYTDVVTVAPWGIIKVLGSNFGIQYSSAWLCIYNVPTNIPSTIYGFTILHTLLCRCSTAQYSVQDRAAVYVRCDWKLNFRKRI